MIASLLVSIALADIPPQPDYVETCTTSRCGSNEARACSAYFGGREECAKLESEGFIKICQTRGASTWTEVLCKGGFPENPGTPPTPATPPASTPTVASTPKVPVQADEPARCDTTAGAGGLGLALLLSAALVRRR
jgi:hypothetical protein